MMRTELPHPSQPWKHGSIRVIVVAVSPNTVTYEDMSGPAGVTRDHLSTFLTVYARPKSPSIKAGSERSGEAAWSALRAN